MTIHELFFVGLQSCLGTIIGLIFFLSLIIKDQLITEKVKQLFIIAVIYLYAIIAATWADRCLSGTDAGPLWVYRIYILFILYSFSPVLPMIMSFIYKIKADSRYTRFLIIVPELINVGFCFVNIFNGCVFSIDSSNVFTRGYFYFIPYAVSAYYILSLVTLSKSYMIRPNVKTETYILIMTAIADVFAFSLELIFNIGYLLWNTTAFCLVIYFAVINIQTVLYDPLTGAFSRVSYSKRLEKLNKSIKSDNYMFIMIDLDHLKQINDTYGHASGDNAIQTMTGNILSRIDRKMSLYRYGGDEFILICKNTDIQKIEKLLTESQKSCADSNNKDITFSYGMSEYRSGDDLHCVIENADKKMYEMKHLHEQ